jgi:hypothetical protein
LIFLHSLKKYLENNLLVFHSFKIFKIYETSADYNFKSNYISLNEDTNGAVTLTIHIQEFVLCIVGHQFPVYCSVTSLFPFLSTIIFSIIPILCYYCCSIFIIFSRYVFDSLSYFVDLQFPLMDRFFCVFFSSMFFVSPLYFLSFFDL